MAVRPNFFAWFVLAVCACGQPSDNGNDLPEVVTTEMAERYERVMAHPKPPAGLIDAVEAQVAGNDCVGGLDRWERFYSFGLNNEREVDESKILFHFREAGVHGFLRGRRVTTPAEWVNIDDRDYDLVFGSFDRTSGKLVVDFCGPNLGGSS